MYSTKTPYMSRRGNIVKLLSVSCGPEGVLAVRAAKASRYPSESSRSNEYLMLPDWNKPIHLTGCAGYCPANLLLFPLLPWNNNKWSRGRSPYLCCNTLSRTNQPRGCLCTFRCNLLWKLILYFEVSETPGYHIWHVTKSVPIRFPTPFAELLQDWQSLAVEALTGKWENPMRASDMTRLYHQPAQRVVHNLK